MKTIQSTVTKNWNEKLLSNTLCLFLPSSVQILNGQRKYQIRLKSSSGPIEVLLVNKDPSSTSPVVLPVPPPEDVLQNLPAPTPPTTNSANTPVRYQHTRSSPGSRKSFLYGE